MNFTRSGSVVRRPRFGYKVVRWRRGDGASQAEPGVSAKGHSVDRMFLHLQVSARYSCR